MPTSSDKAIAIKIRHLIKKYALSGGNIKSKNITALDNLSLDIYQGEVIGVIGPNGSGKSTLLKILSEITAPDSGTVEINGKVASILEVGTGFNPDLSGRENIFLNARLHGMKKKEVNTKFNKIVELFGFPGFLDTPVKQYSSGMYMRLAFAVVIHIDADIYLFDEVLSVGDIKFRGKALSIIKALKKKRKTLCIVTHSPDFISPVINKMMLLNKGEKVFCGTPSQTIIEHKKMVSTIGKEKAQTLKMDELQLKDKKNIINYDTLTSFDITSFKIFNTNNQNNKLITKEDIIINLNIQYFALFDIYMVLIIKDQYDVILVTHNITLESVKKSTSLKCKITIPSYTFNANEYIIGIFTIDENYQVLYGYPNLVYVNIESEQSLEVSKMQGYINLPLEVEFDD
ncbi:MAG: ABC transporter ATP-binding protein [Bacteroidota bacterium]